jgi:hypothetical protein
LFGRRCREDFEVWESVGDERVDEDQGTGMSSLLGRPRIMMAQGCAIR